MLRTHCGEWLPQELQARREQVRKARTSLSGQLERLTEAYLAGVVPLAEYKRRRQEVEQRLEALDNQARQIAVSVQQQMEVVGITSSISEFCQRVSCGLQQATFEQKRRLVELLIDRVVVTNEEVEIRYVIPTSACSEQFRFCHLLTDYFMAACVCAKPTNGKVTLVRRLFADKSHSIDDMETIQKRVLVLNAA